MHVLPIISKLTLSVSLFNYNLALWTLYMPFYVGNSKNNVKSKRFSAKVLFNFNIVSAKWHLYHLCETERSIKFAEIVITWNPCHLSEFTQGFSKLNYLLLYPHILIEIQNEGKPLTKITRKKFPSGLRVPTKIKYWFPCSGNYNQSQLVVECLQLL